MNPVIRQQWSDPSPWPQERPVIVLGFFDGLHLGHRALLERARSEADQRGSKALIMSFDPHPSALIPGMEEAKRIYSQLERDYLIQKHGWVDEVVEICFTEELRDMSPEEFVQQVLVDRFHPSVVIVGEDFRFGRGNSGSAEGLAQSLSQRGIQAVRIPQVEITTAEGTEKVSSTRIRQHLEKGEMEEAAQLLSEPYFLCGSVEHGKGLGHKELVPTVNLPITPDKICPAKGVYVTRTYIQNEETGEEEGCWSVSNIGRNPTVEGKIDKRSETFLLDFQGDLYGKKLRVEFLHHTRSEIHFESIDALRAQLVKDVENARNYAKAHAQEAEAAAQRL